jgi:hypothetical protein
MAWMLLELGRINRATYLIALVLIGACCFALTTYSDGAVWVAIPLLVFVSVPRFHDLGVRAELVLFATAMSGAVVTIFQIAAALAGLAIPHWSVVALLNHIDSQTLLSFAAGVTACLAVLPGQEDENAFGLPPARGPHLRSLFGMESDPSFVD